jgi:predicted nucleic acid-binding protein
MIALDTNVLIYACDKSETRRQQIALDLIADAKNGVLLWQVACEFVAASRKLSEQGFTASNAWDRLSEFVAVLRLALPTVGILERARGLHLTHGVSFWDATILAACAETGVDVLYSEDVPGLDTIGGLRVVNPFT